MTAVTDTRLQFCENLSRVAASRSVPVSRDAETILSLFDNLWRAATKTEVTAITRT